MKDSISPDFLLCKFAAYLSILVYRLHIPPRNLLRADVCSKLPTNFLSPSLGERKVDSHLAFAVLSFIRKRVHGYMPKLGGVKFGHTYLRLLIEDNCRAIIFPKMLLLLVAFYLIHAAEMWKWRKQCIVACQNHYAITGMVWTLSNTTLP